MSLSEEGLNKLEGSAVDSWFLCSLEHLAVADRVKCFLEFSHHDDARDAERWGLIKYLVVK